MSETRTNEERITDLEQQVNDLKSALAANQVRTTPAINVEALTTQILKALRHRTLATS